MLVTELSGRNLLDGTVEVVINKKKKTVDAETDSETDSAQFCFYYEKIYNNLRVHPTDSLSWWSPAANGSPILSIMVSTHPWFMPMTCPSVWYPPAAKWSL